MKAIFISFNQAYFETISLIMDRNNIKGFTYWETVLGRGSNSGEPHMGSHAWPTLNGAILAIVDEDRVKKFLNLLNKLDKQTENLGLRAFVWTIDETI